MASGGTWANPGVEATSLVAELRREHAHSLDDVATAVRTLRAICRRLVDSPAEPKVHRLRAANPKFFKEVGRLQAAAAVLRPIGFAETADGF